MMDALMELVKRQPVSSPAHGTFQMMRDSDGKTYNVDLLTRSAEWLWSAHGLYITTHCGKGFDWDREDMFKDLSANDVEIIREIGKFKDWGHAMNHDKYLCVCFIDDGNPLINQKTKNNPPAVFNKVLCLVARKGKEPGKVENWYDPQFLNIPEYKLLRVYDKATIILGQG